MYKKDFSKKIQIKAQLKRHFFNAHFDKEIMTFNLYLEKYCVFLDSPITANAATRESQLSEFRTAYRLIVKIYS